MWWRKCGQKGPPTWQNGGSSGHRCRTRSPMVSLEPPWKDASVDTPNTLIKGPWGHQNYFLQNQRYLRPPMSNTAADGLIETAMQICIYRHPTHPDQRSLRPPTPFWCPLSTFGPFDRPNKAAAVRDWSDLKQRHILTAAGMHGRPLWNGLGKNYLLHH